ncbi:mechanosensitive ion channel family protein [Planctomonas psychrotolerans]|uniref:mechanosensitive ion channel family protein n=1 Tax=Planctomonas psychrotolerans TaxID=2528712 RepID=UPI001238679B|nr:mechanosensitive ion channel domain-containing protein [Planctomonas psychrotolerans]
MDAWSQIVDDILARGADLAVRTVAAVAVAVVIGAAGMLFRPVVRRRLQKQGRPSRTRVFTALYSLLIAVVAVLVPITLAFPSVRVVDVLASLGVISVAVGFAFKDVLENLLAGVLLLMRDPFKSGDQITVAGYEGTVEGITVRETLLRTTDGERVLIPNAHVYTGALEVHTHFPIVRVTFRLLVDARADPERIRSTITGALVGLGARDAPGPDVILRGARDGALEMDVRLWAESDRASRTAVIDSAVPAALRALREADIDLDQPRTVLVHGSEESPAGTGQQ